MALQQINWLQIDTANVPSGSVVDLGAISGALHAVYADNIYLSGQTLGDVIAGSGTDALNLYTASLNQAIELTGSNLTVKGNLLVKGTTTAVNSTTVAIGDNIIELNGSAATNGGLLIKDPTAPNTISGSLLWDSTNDYWKAGQLGSEEKIILISELNSATSSLSSSINILSGSLSGSISQLSSSLSASINTLSGSVSVSIDDLYQTIDTVSGSIDNRIDNVSSSLGDISSSIDTRITNLSSSLSASIDILSASIDNRIDNVSSSLGEISSSIDTNITNVSSSFSSSISTLSGSLSTRIDALNQFSSSVSGAIEITGSNVTIKGNLLVKGTTTAVESNTISIGDNVIELNGSEAAFGGLLIKDATNPDQISGSLLWDATNDYWIGGPLGSEEKIILQSDLDNVSSSISTSISELSSSVDTRIDNLTISLNASNIWQETGSFYATNETLQITGSQLMTSPDGATTAKYAMAVSQSIHAANINVGTPTSNDWKTSLEGSYFNNFDKNTDVSEILRFVAGLL